MLSKPLGAQNTGDSARYFISGAGYNNSAVQDRGMSPLIYDGSGVNSLLGGRFERGKRLFELDGRFIYGRLRSPYDARLILLDGAVGCSVFRRLQWHIAEEWSLYFGGRFHLRGSYREREGYGNSATRLDCYAGLSPVFKAGFHPKWGEQRWRLEGQIAFALFGMVLRPDYATSTPEGFHDGEDRLWQDFWESVVFVLPDRWIRMHSHFECTYFLRNGNALGLRYLWSYSYFDDRYGNDLDLAGHRIECVTKFSF